MALQKCSALGSRYSEWEGHRQFRDSGAPIIKGGVQYSCTVTCEAFVHMMVGWLGGGVGEHYSVGKWMGMSLGQVWRKWCDILLKKMFYLTWSSRLAVYISFHHSLNICQVEVKHFLQHFYGNKSWKSVKDLRKIAAVFNLKVPHSNETTMAPLFLCISWWCRCLKTSFDRTSQNASLCILSDYFQLTYQIVKVETDKVYTYMQN